MRKAYPKAELALRREGVASVRVFLSDLTIRTVDNQFRTLISGNLTSNPNSLLLCGCPDSCTAVACALYLPASVRMWCYMLVLSHHSTPLQVFLKELTTAQDIVPRSSPRKLSDKESVIFVQVFQQVVSHLLTRIAGSNKPSRFCDMSPFAIGFDGLIKLIIILSWGTEVILDNQRLHITTSLSETGDTTAMRAFTRIS